VTTAPPLAARLSGAASTWARDQLVGPDREARVVHTGADAVYVDLGGSCLGVLSARAAAVPCGIRTLQPRLIPPVRVGDTVLVGSGRMEWGRAEVRVGRVVDHAVPTLDPADARWARRHVAAPALEELPPTALIALRAGDPAAVPALLGLGGGLTPVGDDVLAGWLAATTAADHSGRYPIVDQIERLAPARTTLLSATLLSCAARGDVLPEYAALVAALRHRDPWIALERLTTVGHTSGLGMLLGLVLALDQIADPRRPPQRAPWRTLTGTTPRARVSA
jgi:hypothetical protein